MVYVGWLSVVLEDVLALISMTMLTAALKLPHFSLFYTYGLSPDEFVASMETVCFCFNLVCVAQIVCACILL